MIPFILKNTLVPGSIPFLIIALVVGTLLLYRQKNGGRAGRLFLSALALAYWVLSTPVTAVALIRLSCPDYPPVDTREQARGATAIVVLGAGQDTYRSRGGVFDVGSPEYSRRMLEAARVYRLLDPQWVVVTGGLGSERRNEAQLMSEGLQSLGIPEDRIIEEPKSTNTRDHTFYVPLLLRAHQVEQFVLVTSRQHMARSLRAFRKVGLDPVPSSPEFFEKQGGLEDFLPSKGALSTSEELIYDDAAMVYYWFRGWI